MRMPPLPPCSAWKPSSEEGEKWFPPVSLGTIAILTTDHGRYTRFWTSCFQQDLPGPVKLEIMISSVNLAEARNRVLREAQGDWVWFLDDDHYWDGDLLKELLAREVDIVAPVVLKREHPFGPVHMLRVPEAHRPAGKEHIQFGMMALASGQSGLFEVDAVGTAGMLIRRRVWEALPFPWFTCGEMGNREVLSEDLYFCTEARKAGFKVHVDLDRWFGHLMTAGVRAARDSRTGEWFTAIDIGGSTIMVPAAQPTFSIPAGPRIVIP